MRALANSICHASLVFFLTVPAVLASEEAASPAVGGAKSTPAFDAERYQKEVVQSPELPNFHAVHPFLYRGGAPSEAGMQKLLKKKVSTVIDLRQKGEIKWDEEDWARKHQMKYIHLPMDSQAPTDAQAATFMSAVEAAEKGGKEAVFVHCAHGSDRTGCLVGIWRVRQDGWNYDRAYEEMRHYWFTPKFTRLSGSVRQYAEKQGKQP